MREPFSESGDLTWNDPDSIAVKFVYIFRPQKVFYSTPAEKTLTAPPPKMRNLSDLKCITLEKNV